MPYHFSNAGKSTRQMAKNRRTNALIFTIFGIVLVVVIYLLITNSKELGIGGIGLLILLGLLRIAPDLVGDQIDKQGKAARRADRGAVAEEKIGDLLEELDDESFVVLHDVESPYGNIDHLVISEQNGIFLLETKSHRGRVHTDEGQILINGYEPEKDFIAQALKNSYWVRDQVGELLGTKPWVTAAVVFTNAFVEAGKPIKGVHVLNKKFLIRFLHSNRRTNAINSKIWAEKEQVLSLFQG